MNNLSTRLLWHALFFRLLRTQKRLFVFATVTVSLGVALALGIRLGTESATRSLQETSFSQNPNWSEPLTAHNPAAVLYLREQAMRNAALVFSILETQGLQKSFWGEKNLSLQIIFPWSGANQESSRLCSEEFANIKGIRIGEKYFPVPLVAASELQLPGQPCRIALIDPLKIADNKELREKLNFEFSRQPVQFMFRVQTDEEKQAFAELKKASAQIAGIDSSSNQQRLNRLEDVTRSFRTNLQLMGFIALFIGFAMVHHVFSLLIARQSKTFATLSALGISRRRQGFILISLAIFLGVLASSFGTVLGLFFGSLLSLVTSTTVKNLYDSLVDSSNFYWRASDLLYGFGLGFAACFLGALYPITRIRKLPVAQVMREGGFEAHQTGLSTRQAAVLSGLVTAASLALLQWKVVWQRIPVTALAACLGFLIASALAAQIIAQVLYHSNKLRSTTLYWQRNLRLFVPPQAAVIVQVLTLTFTLTFGVKGMAESFRRTVSDWAQESLRADLWIRSVGGAGTSLPDKVLQRLEKARMSEALAIDSLTVIPALLAVDQSTPKKPVLFANANLTAQSIVTPLKLIAPEGATAEVQSSLARDLVQASQTCLGTAESPCLAYISEPVQVHFRLDSPLGKVLCPQIQTHTICFKVHAVYQDFGSDQGVILSDASIYERLTGERVRPSFANVYLSDSDKHKTTQLENELREFAKSSDGTLGFETLADLQKRILETFDNTFRVTDALYLLSGFIAIVATVSSMNMQIQLRRREWNIQWALGVSAEKIGRRFAFWSAFMAILAAAVSIFGGIILSAILVHAVNYYSFGYTLTLSIPVSLPLIVLVVAGISGYLSGRMQSKTLTGTLSSQALVQE